MRHAGGQARKLRCAPEAALKRPASCSPSLSSPSLIPIFQENDIWKKKMDLNGNKTPYPPNPRHYGAVTVGGEGGKEHFGRATFGGAAVGRLGMSVLRDAAYATLGARASLCACRDTRSHFELAYDGVARLARPQTRTCICLFSSRRACAVSAFSAFGHLGPHMRLCARKGPFPRGFSALAIFFYFFSRLMDTNFWLEVARCLYMQEEEVEAATEHATAASASICKRRRLSRYR